MPRCPTCFESVALARWLSQCAQDGALHTRCNQCHSRIRVFIPWQATAAILFAPLLLAALLQHRTQLPALMLLAGVALAWTVGVPLGYAVFGRVEIEGE